MNERDRLIELLCTAGWNLFTDSNAINQVADHLIANGVIVPPCKVGDTVYRLREFVDDDECCKCEHYRIGGFGDPSECARTFYGKKHPDCIRIVEETLSTMEDVFQWLAFESFGKTVFLTREEAEQALKERGGANA